LLINGESSVITLPEIAVMVFYSLCSISKSVEVITITSPTVQFISSFIVIVVAPTAAVVDNIDHDGVLGDPWSSNLHSSHPKTLFPKLGSYFIK